ncbi:MAG TPA: hypothetical protein DCS19_03725 [Flavobacterium sp.]|nr:hypothetical protein [Flavobacterium sp.]
MVIDVNSGPLVMKIKPSQNARKMQKNQMFYQNFLNRMWSCFKMTIEDIEELTLENILNSIVERPFCSFIKILRILKGFTIEEVAEKLNVSKMAISQYESGTLKPTPQRIKELAIVLDIKEEYLIHINSKEKEV